MLDLALILSPFVSRAGVRGGARFLSSFSRPRFSGERAPGGHGVAFCSSGSPLSAEPHPSRVPGENSWASPRVPSLCLLYYSCLSSRLFQFACHLHTFHFSFLTPAEGQGAGRWGEGRGGALLLSSPNAVAAEMLKSGLERRRDGPGQ